MKLWLVTFDLDNTQFLVDANTGAEAINDAIFANADYELLGEIDNDEITSSELRSKENYSIEPISLQDLGRMFGIRTDCLGISNLKNNVIVFNG